MAIEQDILFVRQILPDHYKVREAKSSGSIHCKSSVGISDTPPEEVWNHIFRAIKRFFGDRFQEVFHNTCANHVDFTIYLNDKNIVNEKLNEYVIVKGTQLKLGGIPVVLKEDTVVLTGSSLEKISETRKAIHPRNKSNALRTKRL